MAERSACSTRCCGDARLRSATSTRQTSTRWSGRSARDAVALRRDTDEPGDDDHRPGSRRGARPSSRPPSGRGQHLRKPCLQRPIELGADLVVHSTTKYLNGHSDSIGGVVVAVRDDDIEWLRFVQNSAGAILSPFDSWLVLRGTKTLSVRMVQHSANGQAIARVPGGHPKVRHVYYPGLPRIRSTRLRRDR